MIELFSYPAVAIKAVEIQFGAFDRRGAKTVRMIVQFEIRLTIFK
jgi:hypothetical protein